MYSPGSWRVESFSLQREWNRQASAPMEALDTDLDPQDAIVRRHYLLPASIAIANCAIFLFQIMLARIASPAEYGELLALLGVLLIIEAPASTVQVLLARAVQRTVPGSSGREPALDLGPVMAGALAIGVGLSGILLVLMPLLGHFLHMNQAPYLVAIYVIPVFLAAVPRGVLAGLGDFRSVSLGLIVSATVRLVAGTILVHAGYGADGAIGAVVIGEVISGCALLIQARRRTRSGADPLDFEWRAAIGEGTAFTGLWVLIGIDLVLARHFLPQVQAGEYGAAATLSQVVMILPGAVAAILFPRLSGMSLARERSSETRLVGGVSGIAVVSLIVVALVQSLVRPLLRLVFDPSYLGAGRVTTLLLLSASALGLLTVVLQYLVGRHELIPASMSWLGVVGFVIAVSFWHQSMHELGLIISASSAATLAVMLLVALHGARYLVPKTEPASLADVDASLDLTVVVPYYNPGSTLAPNVGRLLDVLRQSSIDFEIIAVSDGSTDGSELTITHFADQRLQHVVLPLNQGKGAALRVGLATGRGRYLGFIDADGDLDPYLLEAFMALLNLYQPDIVIGSKRHPLSTVDYPPLRLLYSVGFQFLVRLLFRLNVRDTQTGLKLVRRDVLAASLPRMLEKRFAFDLELLVVARRLGYRRFLEAPVTLHHQFTSTISARSVWHTFVDTMAIFYRLRFLRTYDRSPTHASSSGDWPISPAFVRGSPRLGR